MALPQVTLANSGSSLGAWLWASAAGATAPSATATASTVAVTFVMAFQRGELASAIVAPAPVAARNQSPKVEQAGRGV